VSWRAILPPSEVDDSSTYGGAGGIGCASRCPSLALAHNGGRSFEGREIYAVKETLMRSSSIDLTSKERCPVCDFAFWRALPTPVREHGVDHRRYLAACEGTGAPADRVKREGRMCVRATGVRSTEAAL
jgi:hypothetical protein